MNKFVLRSKRSSSNKFMTEMWMMHNNCSHFLEHLYVMFFTYTISFCYDSMFTQSVQYNHSVVSDPLWSHGLQHARPSCPSPTPGVYSNSNVHWVSDAIQPSHPLFSPAHLFFNLSQHQGLFQWLNSSHQLAKVLDIEYLNIECWILNTMNIQD